MLRVRQASLLQILAGLAGRGWSLISAGTSVGVRDQGPELPSSALCLADLVAGQINKPSPSPSPLGSPP